MRRLLQITLGVLPSVGGFLDVGAITTSAQAGAEYRFRLLWAVALGTLCIIFLVEMAGRRAAVSKHTIVDAMRARLGFRFYVLPLAAELVMDFLTLAAGIGGVALQLATGIRAAVWAIPVAFCVWLLLWKGTLGLIENGVSLLGLLTLVFVYAALRLHPHWGEVGRGLLPSLPHVKPYRYLFIVAGIIGAIISPYLLYFYSSGAVEEQWDESYLGANKVTATLGMGFGSHDLRGRTCRRRAGAAAAYQGRALPAGGVLVRRLSRRLAERLAEWRHKRGVRPSGPYRAARADVEGVGITVRVRAEAGATPMMDWDLWLRRHVIDRIPGSGAGP